MAEGATGWLKVGCLGCLGLVGLVVIVVVGVFGLAALESRSERIEDRVLAPELARPAAPTPGAPGAPAAFPAGRVVLDLRQATFEVAPAPAGESLRVEASYDTRAYELIERHDPADADGWTYSVAFRRTGLGLLTGIKELLSGNRPRVQVLLPRDVPYDLELRLAEGGSDVELGGLWLRSLAIDFQKGGCNLGFAEPLREPLERMTLRGAMGGLDTDSIGNASPRVLDIDFSMGGANLDLRGAWAGDADISVSSRMGGASLWLPAGVDIVGLERGGARVSGGGEELRRPRLTFSVTTSMGELTVVE